jgi:hypothetical protein
MVTLEDELHQEPMTTLRRESFDEVGLSAATLLGTMGGAVAGSILGAGFGTAYPSACAILGTALGGALTAGAWVLFEHLRANFFHGSLAPRDRE